MSSRPSISVVTTVKNGAATIADCLRSVREQSRRAHEHIVVDGGSEDGTLEILEREHGSTILEPGAGIYEGMNLGIRSASGDVVGILNADDVYAEPDVLERVAAAFSDAGVDACYGDLDYVDASDGRTVRRRWRSGPYAPASFRWGWMPPHPTFFVRRRLYEQYGSYDPRLGTAADYELMLRFLVRYGVRAVYVRRVLVKMRMGGASGRSWKDRFQANRMDRLAWRLNGLHPLPWTLLVKPLRKVTQLVAVPVRS